MRDTLFERYQGLQAYVGWTEDDARRLASAGPVLAAFFTDVVEDFYAEIDRHEETRHVLTGGASQQERLKRSLLGWLHELFGGRYDVAYVERRWRVGHRHFEIGLDQAFTNAAASRLKRRLAETVDRVFPGDSAAGRAIKVSLELIIDLDLAIIQDAYQTEFVRLREETERAARLAETQQIQEALAISEQALRAVLQAAPCMIVILNREGTIRYFSPYAEELTGYAAEELLGADYFSHFITSAELAAAIRAELAQTLAGTPTVGFTNPIRGRDGVQRWMVWNTQRIADYQQEPAVLAVGQDITALRQAQNRVVQNERLAAIGEMMAGLAHESRNALQRSQACLEMLALEITDRPQALRLVDRIQNAQDSLHQLYEEVRDYAAPIRLELGEHNLRRIMEDTWDNLLVERQGRIASLVFESSPGIPKARVDARAIEQVFRNILENALTASADPVEIRVRTSETAFDSRASLAVSIGDNGPGLDAETRTRIFEPFFTTKTKGTGLGMAIAKRLVEAHGGSISLDASAARGAEIVVIVPRDGPLEARS
ncbi:MAG: PAS domain S-box protein [Planctomycetaceae bacterium]|nr:MAG: PAS domain S-box protein [Planctomycetaceae bacterium]